MAKKKTNALDFLAVLGRPASQPQLGNYYTGITETSLLYTDKPEEIPINIIDMSSVVSSVRVFCTPSGGQFAQWLSTWNNWITTLSACLSPLVTIGSESGVSALMTVLYTNTQQDAPPSQLITVPATNTQKAKVVSRSNSICKNIGTPLMRVGVGIGVPVNPSYLDAFTEKEVTCNNVLSTPIAKYITLWILPVALSQGEANQASLQTWQTFQIQPYRLPRAVAGGAGGEFPVLFPKIAARHAVMAQVDVRAFATQQQNEMIEELITLGKQGRGGFFASLAGTLAGGLLGPEAGTMVSGLLGSL